MSLKIPPTEIAHFKKFLELSDEQIQGFLDALAKAAPQFSVSDLSKELAGQLKIPSDLIQGILVVLGSLYITRDSQSTPSEEFLDQEVSPALKQAGVFSKENVDAEWAKLRKFLVAASSLEDTVGTTAKAGHILTQHERVFVRARILTDIRPIFHLNVSEKPRRAVIIHMLKISQRDNYGNFADQYFALDSNDIRNFKTLIDRALKKETTLKELMADSGVSVLTPKEA